MPMVLLEKHYKILRFLLAGGSAAAVEYASFLLLNYLSVPIIYANTFSFLCGLFVSFTLNKLWVFKSQGKTHKQFSIYFLLALINLCISNLSLWALVYHLGVWAPIAKILTMASIATWNYVFFSRLIFKDDK